MENDLITRKEAMSLLKCTTATMWMYTKSNRISYYRIGKRLLFDRNQVLNEIRKSKTS